ncbi:MAG: hypothetical protein R3C40_03170 [Parvularculaceae bacterium]
MHASAAAIACWRIYPRIMMEENRRRAQRYGVTKSLIDFGRGESLPYASLLEEILELSAKMRRRLRQKESRTRIASNARHKRVPTVGDLA